MKYRQHLIAALFILALTKAVLLTRWQMANPLAVGGDAYHGIAWIPILSDTQLFHNCIYTQFYSFMFSTLGYRAILQLLAFFIDPMKARIVLMVALYGLTALLILLATEHVWSFAAGITAYVLFVLNDLNMNWFMDGMARSFVLPLMLFAFYAIGRKNLRIAYFAFGLIALFHPLVFPCAYLLFAMTLFADREATIEKLSIPVFFAALALAYRLASKPAFIGDLIRLAAVPDSTFLSSDIKLDEPWGLWKRLIDVPIIIFHGLPRIYIVFCFIGGGVGMALCFKSAIKEQKRPIDLLLRLIPVAIMSYLVSLLLYPRLYGGVESLYWIDIFLLIVTSIGLTAIIKSWNRKWLPTVLVGFLATVQIASWWIPNPMALKAHSDIPFDLMEFIRKTPKDTLIAAPPGLAGQIPLFCRRKVFFDPNAYNAAMYPQFLGTIQARETLNALWTHTTKPDILTGIREQFGVRYLILSRGLIREPFNAFLPWRYHPYQRPSNEQIEMYFSTLSKTRKIWRFGQYIVVDL